MKSKAYEILYILKTDFTEEQRKKIVEKVEGFITNKGGSIITSKELGLKDFAMELKKQRQGYYFQCHFMANNEQLENLQMELKVTEDIFRFLIVTLDTVLSKEELASTLAKV